MLSLWAFATASAPTPPASRASWGPSAQGWTGKIKPFWFGANSSTGLDNDATLALMAKHTVAGYGWQTGGADHLGAAALGRGESFGGSAVEHAVDYMQSHGHGNVTIFQYRQVQVALSLFAENLIAASNPANEHFWLHDTKTKEICTGKQPWGTDDYYWNFTDSGAVDYWIEKAIGELTRRTAPYFLMKSTKASAVTRKAAAISLTSTSRSCRDRTTQCSRASSEASTPQASRRFYQWTTACMQRATRCRARCRRTTPSRR